ncbi:WASH complex subunit 2 isoform X1 [Pieris brassicae]|uniref:WASH complex subunit 2 isoform X1 n=1 Tax=Pieris brassicae TaxID=7116 RepID=UPI001E65EB6B|nr:WASH complex subunit 2 isoform X1 [Pieris brassicae]XP_045528939.1 WASH complex subunit 2 isoform X1 [Pieris brassicae]XP_045528940.1 WASH complex subunit 2 isoform X1 [Pieris brassicae]
MEKVDLDTLRSLSSKWSLGGDKRLLDLLQNIHHKVVTKCTETNTKLNELINKLDTASIDLQNVNNKFMALSNTQFIERRVYDDDVDIAPPVEPPKEPPKIIDPNEELEKLKKSLQTFESMHEVVQILDSDSSDDEDEERLVLKPKNVYANRPLPYIIGSELWRTKWHAGLVVEDSDTDSAASKHEPEEEYSDSEPEVTDTQTDKHIEKDTWISSSPSAEASVSTSLNKPAKPADIAAELARRLGGDMIPPPPPMEAMPEPTTKKVYRPEQPTTATIFSNEPPPLDQVQSDSDEDIFAELHRNRYTHNDRTQPVANVVDELFGNVSKESSTKNTQVLCDEDSESELFAEKPQIKEKSPEIAEESIVKKPVGGISLFGSNKHSISIGAAILKRQQPKSSDEESDNSESPKKSDIAKPKPSENSITNIPVVPKDTQEKFSSQSSNKDIIEHLFAKPKSKNTKNKTTKQETKEKIPDKKVDLFTDDLFDDIDDIFTSKITKTPDTRGKEKLFDSDDDLFNEKVISKPQVSQAKRSLVFSDSDDDLFNETNTTKIKNNSTTVDKEVINKNGANAVDETPKPILEKEINTSKSNKNENNYLFNNKDLTKEVVNKKDTNKELNSKIENNVRNERVLLISSDFPLEIDNDTKNNKEEPKKSSKDKNNKFESILDAESDDDLFKNNTVSDRIKVSSLKTSIFDDDSEDELFGNVLPISNKEMPQTKNNLNINETIENRTNIIDSLEKVDSQASISNATLYPIVPEEVVKTTEKTNVSLFNDESDKELFGDKNENPTIEDTKSSMLEDTVLSNFSTEMSQHKTIFQDPSNKVINREPNKSSATIEDKKSLQISYVNLDDTVNTDFRSPLVFNDDEMDELLTSNSKTSKNIIENTPDNKKRQEMYLNAPENLMESIINTNATNEILKSESEGVYKETLQPSLPVSSQTDGDIQKNEYNKLEFHEEILKESKIVYDVEEDENTFTEPLDKETSPFSEIFNDVPPEFEKPKEPKRSKNVNALFDDDSDDETMFFKKSSDVSDDLPSPDYTQARFSLFHDEPPSIDVDFTEKSSKSLNVEEIIKNTQTDLSKEKKLVSSQNFNEIETTNVDRNIKKNLPNDFDINADEFPQSLESSIRSTNAMISDKIIKLQTDVKKPIEIKEKSIGKLKPVHFNINVNTLLPGAAHKKPKLVEELDGSASSKAENNEFEKKTNNFKEKESAILDNKLSKERARIPVKRRPSTRRARLEAARKSGIDFGESIDSTDNSSSIDEPSKDNTIEDTNKNVTEVESIKIYNSDAESSKSTTKVVYILNDEDIFSDENKNVQTDSNCQDLNSQTSYKNVDTPSTTEKDTNQNGIDKKSIFDLSDSETELFGAKKSNVTPKTKLFDSDTDDDNDLFGSKKQITVKEEKQNLLFSDESDGELFSTSKQEKKISNKPSEPVFQDPLSMLNQDDS